MKPTIEIPPPTFLTGRRLFVLVLLALLVFVRCGRAQTSFSVDLSRSTNLCVSLDQTNWVCSKWETNCTSPNVVGMVEGSPKFFRAHETAIEIFYPEQALIPVPVAVLKLESPRGAETFRSTAMKRHTKPRRITPLPPDLPPLPPEVTP